MSTEREAHPTDARVTRAVLEALERSPIEQDPFPHVVVNDVFPSDYYAALLQAIPPASEFVRADYAGTAKWKGTQRAKARYDYGLYFPELETLPVWSGLAPFLRSDTFARALLDKFAAPGSRGTGSAIPVEKHHYFADGQSRFELKFELYRDLPGYEISPHPDHPAKIITFQFYLTPDDSLAQQGTFLCRPKAGVRRRDLEQPEAMTDYQNWFKWDLFEIVRTVEARPNSFLCFAPNEISYHAVKLNIPEDHPIQDRTVLRGFIVRENTPDSLQPHTAP